MSLKPISILAVCVLILAGCLPKDDQPLSFDDQIKTRLKEASSQYQYMADLLSVEQFPKTFEGGQLKTSGSGWWCSGFYPGTLLYLYEATKDPALMNQAKKSLEALKKEQFNTTTHDLGFMMFCSFGNAYRLTGDEAYKEIIHQSAKSLITRFNPTIGCIRSWDPAPWNSKWQYPVIIDNMMNLEMLLWAGKEFGDSTLTNVAITHAETTLSNHFREDYSSYHVVSYDTISGGVEAKNTDQGYADESPWARGQSWALYGYTAMYRFTKDEKYLKQAEGIADFILNHPNMPEDMIPYWDFIAPDIPHAKRDASAAAVFASALIELKDYVSADKGKGYWKSAETMLVSLSSDQYFAAPQTNGGFLLEHGVGNMPDGTEVDVPLTYADYYFVEALLRYQAAK